MSEKGKWILGCKAPACGLLADGYYDAGPMLADDREGMTEEDSKMQVVYEATESDFDAYVAGLKDAGMHGYLERSLGDDKFFAFSYNGKYYHVSFIAKRGEIRVIEDMVTTPVNEFGYQNKGDNQTVFYQYGLYYDPDNNVTDRTVNCGMLYVVKAAFHFPYLVPKKSEHFTIFFQKFQSFGQESKILGKIPRH